MTVHTRSLAAGNPARKPLRTFREFVEEFGVSSGVLRQALQDEDAPKPQLIHSNARTTRNRWYVVQDMRDWWKKRQGASNE